MSRDGGGASRRPWYREIWPWALMLPPLLAVAGGVMMIVLATHAPGGLVVEDYAHIEELTAERFERDRLAVSLGLEAVLEVGPEPGHLELALTAPSGFERPRALVLELHHATDPAADRELRLVRYGERFAADADFPAGRYGVELMPEDRSWRLSAGVARIQGSIRLKAQTAGE